MSERLTPSPTNIRYDITCKRTFLALAGALFLAGAAPAAWAQTPPAPPIKVVASFSILADLVRHVGGERVAVTSLVGPNADAHVYRPTPQDSARLKEAGLIVINGLGFEGFMPRLVRSSGTKAKTVTASTGLKPLQKPKGGQAHGHDHGHDHGKSDPHAWQSIEAVRLYIGNIRDGLIEADPGDAALFRANAERYLTELAALRAELNALFAPIPEAKRVVITNHDAFSYFARDFGFRFEAVQGVSTDAAPSAADVARIIRSAKERKAGAVFIENLSDPRIGERLAKESGAKLGGTLYSDALSDENGPAPTYIAMMRHNGRRLAEALTP